MTGVDFRAAKFRQDFLWRAKREVVQHDHDVLHIARILLAGHHRSCEHQLLADGVRVHPVRAGRELECMGIGLTRSKQAASWAGPVLIGRRFDLPVPVHL